MRPHRSPTHLHRPAGMTDNSATQERIFAALTAHAGVKRIDTHAASVFLDGKRALKIKRAVRFPFLDYSTLDKRKAACEEEIRINRPLAPQIYHRVVAITEEPDGSVKVDGSGRPIEYAVDMSRFDESRTLDHLAKARSFDVDLASAIADAIAASHAAAASRRRPGMDVLHPRPDRRQQQRPAERRTFSGRGGRAACQGFTASILARSRRCLKSVAARVSCAAATATCILRISC